MKNINYKLKLTAILLQLKRRLGSIQANQLISSYVAKLMYCIISFTLIQCTANFEAELELINPPVNVQVTQKTDATDGFTYYEISFSADSREIGFSGYGIFTGTATATETAIENAKKKITGKVEKTAADLFCTTASNFNIPSFFYRVQIGGTKLLSDSNCPNDVASLTTISLSSGMAVVVRARVDRASDVWSPPASRIVP